MTTSNLAQGLGNMELAEADHQLATELREMTISNPE